MSNAHHNFLETWSRKSSNFKSWNYFAFLFDKWLNTINHISKLLLNNFLSMDLSLSGDFCEMMTHWNQHPPSSGGKLHCQWGILGRVMASQKIYDLLLACFICHGCIRHMNNHIPMRCLTSTPLRLLGFTNISPARKNCQMCQSFLWKLLAEDHALLQPSDPVSVLTSPQLICWGILCIIHKNTNI